MVTVKITDEQYKRIEKMVNQMIAQNNRATQYPLFVVQEKRKVYGSSEWCNETERKEEFDGELCESCKKLGDENDVIPEYCDDCDPDCFISFNWEYPFDLRAGVFFTAEACEDHIRANSYHYNDGKSYAISGAWRNPEMFAVLNMLFIIAGKKIPSCYQ